MRKINKLLVANRGEIACRIIYSARAAAIGTVGIFASDEHDALHVRLADEAILLPGDSLQETYLNAEAILDIAVQKGVDAIHPGYGFLSENSQFAAACEKKGLLFIGPEPEVIRFMGNKIAARELAASLGIPVLPSALGELPALISASENMRFPLLIKASAGGGGKGMRLVEQPGELKDALENASREAFNWFGDGSVYLEQYISAAKHIEVQVFGDGKGKVIHLFERECSLQRRYQKLIEEAPSPSLTPDQREGILRNAVLFASSRNYRSSGTVEFLLTPDGDFFFLEMNTRIQVEHPVTEEITGVDLVQMQIDLAETGNLFLNQEDVHQQGHSIEARIYAEDPAAGFQPSPGLISCLSLPQFPGLRIETAFDRALEMPYKYDHLLAKLITNGSNREEARHRMLIALRDTTVLGVPVNTGFLGFALEQDQFVKGDYDTRLATVLAEAYSVNQNRQKSELDPSVPVIAWLAFMHLFHPAISRPWTQALLHVDGQPRKIVWSMLGGKLSVLCDETWYFPLFSRQEDKVLLHLGSAKYECRCSNPFSVDMDLEVNGIRFNLHRKSYSPETSKEQNMESAGMAVQQLIAPLHGRIVKVNFALGSKVEKAAVLFVLEAMKMENYILSEHESELVELNVAAGQQVRKGQLLGRLRINGI